MMVKVRMLVGLSGPAINLIPGDEAEFEADEALRHIAAGNAVAIGGLAPKRERAVKARPAAETR